MNNDEKRVLKKVVKEMKDAHGIIGFWLRGSVIEQTLAGWVKELESLLEEVR